MLKPFVALCTILLGIKASTAQNRSASTTPAAPSSALTFHYGSDPLQFGKLRLPNAAKPMPVVIVIHGGCWADYLPGTHPAPDMSLTESLSAALTSGGVATWNVEYRREGSPGGGWPNTYLDLSKAIDYLRQIAPENKLDLTKVFVVGHSSGGQLALWLGARSQLSTASPLHTENPLGIKEIIDVDGPPDLAAAQRVETQYCPMPAVTEFMGGTPSNQPVRYHDGSAQSFLPLHIPQIIIKAGLLQHVANLAADYKAAADQRGDSVAIVPVQGNHFQVVDPSTTPGQAVVSLILAEVKSKE